MKFEKNKFDTEGYSGPFKFLNEDNCKKLLEEQYIPRRNFTWQKAIHEKSKNVLSVASNPIILEKIQDILGLNILLWGSNFVKLKAGDKHSWHIDLEHRSWDGVTIWIGLKNLNNNTPLSIITYSHMIDDFPQALKDKNIDINNDEDVLVEAKKINSKCELKTFYLKPGEFIIWSGKIWHKTSNLSNKSRESIILQYCSPNNLVKIPLNYDHKNMKWSDDKPTCVLVSGEDKNKLNRILEKSSFRLEESFIDEIFTTLKNKYYKLRFKLSSIYRKIFAK